MQTCMHADRITVHNVKSLSPRTDETASLTRTDPFLTSNNVTVSGGNHSCHSFRF